MSDPDTKADSRADIGPPSGLAIDADGQPVLTLFGLAGRAVPGLYLVGWIASVMGGGVLLVSFFAAGTAAARWLSLAGLLSAALGLFAAAGSQAVERGRRPSLPYRGPSPVLAFLVAVVLALVALVIVVAPLSALGLDAGGSAGTLISAVIVALVYVLVVRLLVVGPGALSWADMGLGGSAGRAMFDLLAGAALAVPVLVVTLGLDLLLGRVLAPVPALLPPAAGTGSLLLDLVAAGVIAPLGDEIFFRGLVTTAWARSLGKGPAIVRGAVFFAAAHILTLLASDFGPGAAAALAQLIALLPLGVALGWVFLGRRSLYAAIGLHAAFNIIQLVLVNTAR